MSVVLIQVDFRLLLCTVVLDFVVVMNVDGIDSVLHFYVMQSMQSFS